MDAWIRYPVILMAALWITAAAAGCAATRTLAERPAAEPAFPLTLVDEPHDPLASLAARADRAIELERRQAQTILDELMVVEEENTELRARPPETIVQRVVQYVDRLPGVELETLQEQVAAAFREADIWKNRAHETVAELNRALEARDQLEQALYQATHTDPVTSPRWLHYLWGGLASVLTAGGYFFGRKQHS